MDHNRFSCPYCDSLFTESKENTESPKPLVPEGLFNVSVGSVSYTVLGLLARSEHNDVLLARRARAATEQVVIKARKRDRSLDDEWHLLKRLEGQHSYLDRLLPLPVARGEFRGRNLLVLRWRPGFIHTLRYVKQVYPSGIESEASVWMWNRILDQLACLRELGERHGAISLDHILVHPRDHGVAFCGLGRTGGDCEEDLGASGRCIGQLLGRNAPHSLRDLTRCAAQFEHPLALKSELNKVARAAFGPPRYRHFNLRR